MEPVVAYSGRNFLCMQVLQVVQTAPEAEISNAIQQSFVDAGLARRSLHFEIYRNRHSCTLVAKDPK
ncbi:hypothetical protein M513_04833 [Trichuris suis]|uniref:Uncharacterized protein n=1 Tax=Trichuris suis TaxID=68888 RepID=A0A085MAP5_9BILA|nr:hypothetical protein M513_04833 [Trichuris suis]